MRDSAAHPPGGSTGPVDVRPPAGLQLTVTVLTLVGPFLVASLPVVGFGDDQAIGWLSAAPLAASLVLGWRRTAAAGVSALAGGLVLFAAEPGNSRDGDLLRLAVLAALSVFAVLNCVLRERREARLRQVREVARTAQSAILQPVPSRAGRWRFAARYRSANAAAAVGGDLIEVVQTNDDRILIVIGDVRGKGLPAVHLAALTLAAFREAALRAELALTEVAQLVDRTVGAVIDDEDFVTALFVELHPDGWVQVVNCGHPPPLRLSPGQSHCAALSPSQHSPPLGLGPRCRADTFTAAPGDRLVLLTDGLLEARDAAGAMVSIDSLMRTLRTANLEEVADDIVRVAVGHAGGHLDDDLAVLVAEAELPPDRSAADR